MKQASLFDLPVFPYGGEPPVVRGSRTSQAAAEHISLKIGAKQRAVLLALHEHGPLSDEALDRVLHATSPYRPRRREMTLAGYIKDSGQTVLGSSGLHMTLWELTDLGEETASRLNPAAAPVGARTGLRPGG